MSASHSRSFSTAAQRERLCHQRKLLPNVACARIALWCLVFVGTASGQALTFRDVTAQAGLRFTHNNGAFGKKWLPETMGPGCAFIDYDNDGNPDILLVNGTDFAGHAKNGATTPHLYRNNGNGTFTDVTAKSGLAVPLYGFGAAIGDYDNDGRDDIFISALGQIASVSQQRQRHFHRCHEGCRHCGVRTSSRRARPGSTTTATANSIWSSPITCSGRRRATLLHA